MILTLTWSYILSLSHHKQRIQTGIQKFQASSRSSFEASVQSRNDNSLYRITRCRDFQLFVWLLKPKAKHLHYWSGQSQVPNEAPKERTIQRLTGVFEMYEEASMEPPSVKRWSSRKLSLRQEFLMTFMKWMLGLLEDDLAFRFKVSQSLVSEILSTWLKFLAKELRWRIIWPSKSHMKLQMPDSFRKFHPNVRWIIDCSEVFTETPGAFEIQAALWPESKRHRKIKFFVAITPNGAPCYVSQCYGGRVTDKCIVRDCDFLCGAIWPNNGWQRIQD